MSQDGGGGGGSGCKIIIVGMPILFACLCVEQTSDCFQFISKVLSFIILWILSQLVRPHLHLLNENLKKFCLVCISVFCMAIHPMQIWRTTPSSPGTSCAKARLVGPRCFVLTVESLSTRRSWQHERQRSRVRLDQGLRSWREIGRLSSRRFWDTNFYPCWHVFAKRC